MVGVDLDERDDREHAQDRDLGAEQELLDARRELDAAIADPGHQPDPNDRGDDDRGSDSPQFGEAEQLEGVDAAICASEAITSTSERKIAQPLTQPVPGPSARVVHAKVVPASGSARLRYL